MKMIEKLKKSEKGPGYYCSGANLREVIAKVNELVDVVNALIDGDFPDSIDRIDFLLKLLYNLRDAQSEVKK